MAIEFLQMSTSEVKTTDLIVQTTLNVHADATYVVFFIGISAANNASDRGLIGILHRYGGDTVSIMKEAHVLDQNQRRYRFQIGRRKLPAVGNNIYQAQFSYTGTKTLLLVALSYKGVDLTGSGMGEVITETNLDNPTSLSVTSTASGNVIVDGMLYRETIPGLNPPGGAPTESGGQTIPSISGVYTIDNDDWGLVFSEKLATASGAVDMGWVGFENAHIHLAGVVVSS